MRTALCLAALLVGCGSPHGSGGPDGSTSRDDGGGGGDDGSGGGDDGAGPDGSHPDGPPTTACPSWCVEAAPAGVTGILYGVHAIDEGDVFVVGDGGVILRRQSNAWTRMTSGTTANLRGVWGATANDVWAVGENGTLLHWSGSAWSAVTGVATANINAIWGSSASDVWAVGPSRVYHYNGTAWSSFSLTGELLAVSGTGPADVWIASEITQVHHWTTTWTTAMPGAGADYYGVVAISPNNVWVSTLTSGKETLQYNGSAWTPHATSSAVFQSLFATGANDVWGAGGSKIGHWDGSAWTVVTPAGITSSLWGVHGAGGATWAVGSGGTILLHD